MIAVLAGLALAALAAAPVGRAAAQKPTTPPPPALNIVHHRLKRGAGATYPALEASIVSAYERAKMPLYWMTFQSVRDPRDILYLNVFDRPEALSRASETYKTLAPAHPELARLAGRLAALIDAQNSTLVTHREEVAYTRPDVDFATMRALRLVTFHVKAGSEGQFMDAVRTAGSGGAPWIVYEANSDSTFVLLSPLRSRADMRHTPPIPRAIREKRRTYRRADVDVYLLSPSMSRAPVEFFAKSKNAPPKPKAH